MNKLGYYTCRINQNNDITSKTITKNCFLLLFSSTFNTKLSTNVSIDATIKWYYKRLIKGILAEQSRVYKEQRTCAAVLLSSSHRTENRRPSQSLGTWRTSTKASCSLNFLVLIAHFLNAKTSSLVSFFSLSC